MDVEFDAAVCRGIATRARGVPRIALRLAERVRDVAQAQNRSDAALTEFDLAMSMETIDAAGINATERELLRCLKRGDPRPVSARGVALALGASVETVIDVLEPPLVRMGFLTIGTGGRRLTEQGRRHLTERESRFVELQ